MGKLFMENYGLRRIESMMLRMPRPEETDELIFDYNRRKIKTAYSPADYLNIREEIALHAAEMMGMADKILDAVPELKKLWSEQRKAGNFELFRHELHFRRWMDVCNRQEKMSARKAAAFILLTAYGPLWNRVRKRVDLRKAILWDNQEVTQDQAALIDAANALLNENVDLGCVIKIAEERDVCFETLRLLIGAIIWAMGGKTLFHSYFHGGSYCWIK